MSRLSNGTKTCCQYVKWVMRLKKMWYGKTVIGFKRLKILSFMYSNK